MGTDDSDDSAEEPRPSEDEPTAQAELSSTSQSEPSRQSSSSHITNGDSQPEDETDCEKPSQSIEDMLLEFDDQDGLIRDRALLDPNYVVE
jgi:cell division control protein 6